MRNTLEIMALKLYSQYLLEWRNGIRHSFINCSVIRILYEESKTILL